MGRGMSKSDHGVSRVLAKVDEGADKLKKDIEEPAFHNAQFDTSARLLTVVKVRGMAENGAIAPGGHATGGGDGADDDEPAGGMIYLADADNNKYALMRPRDTTIMPDDLLLIHALILILVVCFVLGYACSFLGLPPLIGHILTGMLLGPAGMNMISALVQISTIGELGKCIFHGIL